MWISYEIALEPSKTAMVAELFAIAKKEIFGIISDKPIFYHLH